MNALFLFFLDLCRIHQLPSKIFSAIFFKLLLFLATVSFFLLSIISLEICIISLQGSIDYYSSLSFLAKRKTIFMCIGAYKRKITDRQTFMHDAISQYSIKFGRNTVNTMKKKKKKEGERQRQKGKIMFIGNEFDVNFSLLYYIIE